MDFIPNTDKDRELMLKDINVEKISDLFKDVPLRIKSLRIPKGMSEFELKEMLRKISQLNRIGASFLGGGAYKHFIPSVVSHILSRSEFYTAYTPYQPEISQGLLQVIYEYQTMICNLTGMDVANASMYDGASALAESCIMAANITKRKEILVSKGVHPSYREVVKTYCKAQGFSLVEIDYDKGIISQKDLKNRISEDTAALLIQSPNFFGCIEDLKEIQKIVHSNNALLNVCFTEATSLGLIKPNFADIVVGEGQGFGSPVSFGGPYLGIIATKLEYVRQMPGRIVGATTDSEGNTGYILNLQAREQHIRREKACSNICSNQALVALAASVYLSTLGKKGLRLVSELCLQKAHYLAEKLEKAGFAIKFKTTFYNEFVVKVKNVNKTHSDLLKNNIIGGLDLGKYYPELEDCLLICVTELNTVKEMDKVVGVLNETDF